MLWQRTGTTTHPAATWQLGGQPCLPEVLRAEGSVQVRVHVSGALLHSPRVGDERFGLDPFSLDLGAVLHPQVHERHAWHLVAVRPSEYSHSPGLAETHAVVVRGHGWMCSAWMKTRWSRRLWEQSKSFQLELHSLTVFKCQPWLRAYVTCPLACCGQSPCVKCAELCTTSRVAGEKLQLTRFLPLFTAHCQNNGSS